MRPGFARRFLRWEVAAGAVIERSLIRVRRVVMGPGSSIAPRNSIWGLDALVLGGGASLGRNSIGAVPAGLSIYALMSSRRPVLILGCFSGITDGYEIGCSDRVELADYAATTGIGTQVLTHRLDLARDRVATTPVGIGERSFVMTGCILLSGSRIPDHSIISAGSVVVTPLTQSYTLYRGNPAQSVRTLPANLKLFRRVGVQAQLRWQGPTGVDG